MNHYMYEGPIFMFGKMVTDHWKGATTAVSKAKAKSNLIYQAKKAMNLVAGSKVTLPGEIVEIY